MSEINRTLNDLREIDGPEFAAKAALTILQELALKRALDDSDQMHDAIYWLTSKGVDAFDRIEAQNRRARAIASQFHDVHKPFEAYRQGEAKTKN